MMLEFIYGTWSCPANNKCPLIICSLHYLYFAISLFLVSLLTMLAISLFTDPIPDKHVSAAVRGSGASLQAQCVPVSRTQLCWP